MTTRQKSEPFEPYPAWTKARFFGFVRSALRKASNKWPPKYEALHEARRPSESENLKLKWQYQCACCKQWHAQKDVSVDHIEPAGTLREFEDIAKFCFRLFVSKAGLQILCSACHAFKTIEDKEKVYGPSNSNSSPKARVPRSRAKQPRAAVSKPKRKRVGRKV